MSAPILQQMISLDRTLRLDYNQLLNPNSVPSISEITATSSTNGVLTTQSIVVFGSSVYVGVNIRQQGLISVLYNGTGIKNLNGESAGPITNVLTTNNTGVSDVTVPYPIGGTVSGSAVLVYFSEVLNPANVPAASSLMLLADAVIPVLSGLTIYGTLLSMTSTPAAKGGDLTTLTYVPPGLNPLQDYAGLKVSPIAAPMLLTNLSIPSSYYSDQTDLEVFYGVDNIRKWSQLDGGTTADLSRIAQYLIQGDRWIDRKLRENGYNAPLAISSADFDLVSDAHTELVGSWIYMARGKMDISQAVAKGQKSLRDQMADHEKSAKAKMRDLIMRGLDGTKAAFSSAFASVAPAEYPSVQIPGSFTWPYNR